MGERIVENYEAAWGLFKSTGNPAHYSRYKELKGE